MGSCIWGGGKCHTRLLVLGDMGDEGDKIRRLKTGSYVLFTHGTCLVSNQCYLPLFNIYDLNNEIIIYYASLKHVQINIQ